MCEELWASAAAAPAAARPDETESESAGARRRRIAAPPVIRPAIRIERIGNVSERAHLRPCPPSNTDGQRDRIRSNQRPCIVSLPGPDHADRSSSLCDRCHSRSRRHGRHSNRRHQSLNPTSSMEAQPSPSAGAATAAVAPWAELMRMPLQQAAQPLLALLDEGRPPSATHHRNPGTEEAASLDVCGS